MSKPRSIAILFVVTLLLSVAPPLAAAHIVRDLPDSVPVPALLPDEIPLPAVVPDADPFPEVPTSVPVPDVLPDRVDVPLPPEPRELPHELDAACAAAPATCDGVEDTMGDVRRLDLPDGEGHHDVDNTTGSMAHALRDHLLYGACQDAASNCEAIEGITGGDTPQDTVVILAPKDGAGAPTGKEIPITWKAEVVDHANTGALFRVQSRALDGGAWTDVGAYRCWQAEDDDFPAGTCRALWNPAETGLYSLRVVYVAGPDVEPICQVPWNCGLVPLFHVDDVAPVAGLACVLVDGACAIPSGRLDLTTLTVTAAATDDLGLGRLSVRAVSDGRATSCVLHEGTPLVEIEAGAQTCQLDLTQILSSPLPGVYSGFVDLEVEAVDTAGNGAVAGPVRHEVNSEAGDLAVVVPSGAVDRYQPSGKVVNFGFRAVYASPASKAGLPVAGEAFTVSRGATVICSGTTSGSGFFDCLVSAPDGDAAITGAIVRRAGLDSAPSVLTVTWTTLVLTRMVPEDLPAPTLTTNTGGVYAIAYRVTFAYNGAPVPGAVASLQPSLGEASHETTDAAGLVRIPAHRNVSTIASFTPSVALADLKTTGSPVSLTWTRILPSVLAVNDTFVGVGDAVTLAGQARYEHNGSQRVEAATLGLGPGTEDCTLLEGSIVNGTLKAVVRCDEIRTTPVPLVVLASTRAVTSLVSPVSIQSLWTRVNLTNASVDRVLVNVNETVVFRATASYVHDGSLVTSGTVGLGPGAPLGCTAQNGAIVAGNLTVTLRCASVLNGTLSGLPVGVTTDKGVSAILAPTHANVTWTAIDVYDLVVDDALVNVGDLVTLTASARYLHNLSMPVENVTLQAGGPAAGCSFLGGNVTAGVLKATVSCSTVKNHLVAGVPLVVASSESGITALALPLSLRAAWTEVRIGPVTMSDDYVNVNDVTSFSANLTYAHDNSPVPNGTLALALGTPADCTMFAGVLNGKAGGNLRCRVVHDFRVSGLLVDVKGVYHNITRVAGPINVSAVWTRVQIADVLVDDAFTNVSSPVTLTARASYVHDGSPVVSGSVGPGNTTAPCAVLSSEITNGSLRASVACQMAHNASATGFPLVITSAHKGVVNLSAPLSLNAVWTAINVSYALDVTNTTLGAGTAVLVGINLTYAHDGTPVRSGIATLRSSDGDEQQCQTNATGRCTLEIFRTLGSVYFNVTGASSHDGPVLVPDVVRQGQSDSNFSKRWTAIGFTVFECRPAATPTAPAEPCEGSTYAKGAQVLVRARVVAADNESEILAGAIVRVDGEQLTADAQGWVSKAVTRTSAGTRSVTARGISASIDGETITTTVQRTEDIRFE